MGNKAEQSEFATSPVVTAAKSHSGASARAPSAIWMSLAVVILAGAVGLVFGRGLRAPFIFDDVESVENNFSIARLWPLFRDADGPGPFSNLTYSPLAGRPLVNLSFAVNFHFGQFNPVGYHVFNMVVHALSALLLWSIVRRVLLLDYFGGKFQGVAEPLALAVALVWAIHPLQTEPVEYITQRTELMMGWCYLATVSCSLRYFASTTPLRRAAWVVLATLVCTAGMACKEVMVSAPVAVLLLDRTFIAGSFVTAWRRSWPLYLGLSASWALLLALNIGGPRSESAGFHFDVPLYAWWFTQTKVLLMYLKLVVWPWPLVIHYDMPYLETIGAAWPYLLPVAALALATLYLLWRNTKTGLLMGLAFMIISPTLVVPIVTEIAAERRMYLSLAAILPLLVIGGYVGMQRAMLYFAARTSIVPSKKWRLALPTGCVFVLVAALGLLSARRLKAYDTQLAIWQDAALNQPNNELVLDNLGFELIRIGRTQEAIKHYEGVLRQLPKSFKSHTQMGVALANAGRFSEAIEHHKQAVELEPGFGKAHHNWGGTLLMMGQRDGFQPGQLDEVIAHEREAIQINSKNIDAYYNLGLASLLARREEDAIKSFSQGLALSALDQRAWFGLSLALDNLAKRSTAETRQRKSPIDDSDYAEALNRTGLMFLKQTQTDKGVQQLTAEFHLDQKLAGAHNALADLFIERAERFGAEGRNDEARSDLRAAAEYYAAAAQLRPDYTKALNSLGAVLMKLGETDQAIPYFEEAVRQRPEYADAKNNLDRALQVKQGQLATPPRREQ